MPNIGSLPTYNKINYNIEALRGYAALLVVWHHAIVFKYMLDPGFIPTGILSYSPNGHFCVLVFFILSGYVIGLSNKKPLTWATSIEYIKKRLVRLYPIYLILLVLTLLVTANHFRQSVIVGNLALLQGLSVPGINVPAWSLHYEMIYYALFIFISIFRFNPFIVAVAALAIALANLMLYPIFHTPIVTSYCLGLLFWILGLGISRRSAASQQEQPAYQVMLSCLLLILCIAHFNPFHALMSRGIKAAGVNVAFPDGVAWGHTIAFADLSYLPFALVIILIFVDKHIRYKLLFLKILFVLSSINIVYVAAHLVKGDLDISYWALPTLFFVLAVLCLFVHSRWLEEIGKRVIRFGVWLGSLSYALYLAHFPLLLLFSRIKLFSGMWQTFALRFSLLFVLTISIGYLLEIIIQPRIKAFFFRPEPSGKHVLTHK
jgi:peptidoglycan/LPS O-acetylase OafA/YrhL